MQVFTFRLNQHLVWHESPYARKHSTRLNKQLEKSFSIFDDKRIKTYHRIISVPLNITQTETVPTPKTDWQGEYFRCPPPIISIFGYVIEDRKIRNTCFFIFPRFHIWGVSFELRSKLGLKNHFCGISRELFKCEIWLTHQIFKKSIFSTKMIFQPWLWTQFHPPNMKTGKNKKNTYFLFFGPL